MKLTLSRSSTDSRPGHKVSDVLRRQSVQKLTPTRHPRIIDLLQKLSSCSEALVHFVGPVQIRIVDQPFPPHRRPRLLEIHTHDDQQLSLVCLHLGLQPLGVLQCGGRIMDGARPDNHHHAVVLPAHDLARRRSGSDHRVHGPLRRRELLDNQLRVGHGTDLPNAQVVHPFVDVSGLVELDGCVRREARALGSGLAGTAAGLDGPGEGLEALDGCGPPDASVRHGDAVPEGLLRPRGFL
mmetsp:Transcript_112179/g.257043  ORF Transcript_112179/g.257043 Transcript_112179/m.257043 type:complete len:239 (+) Transcript_112179:513-1229(+)